MTYEHLADVFARAFERTKSIESSLAEVDRFRLDVRLRRPDVVDAVLRITAELYGLSIDRLLSRDRTAVIVRARYVAAYALRRHVGLSYPAIGRALRLHHTTVIDGVRMVELRHVDGAGDAVVVIDRLRVAQQETDGATT